MPLKLPKFKTKEEVPAAIIDLYEERDGEWVQKDDEEATGLKTALQKEREKAAEAEKERKKLADKIAEFERQQQDNELGIDSEKAKAFREKTYKEIRAEVQAEVDDLKKQLETAQGETRSLRLDMKVKDLALKNGVSADRVDAWWKLNGDNFDLDDKGEPIVKDGKGKAVDKYIAEDLKKSQPYLYEGTKATGGGSRGGTGDKSTLSTEATSADDILKNPSAALAAARAAEGAE